MRLLVVFALLSISAILAVPTSAVSPLFLPYEDGGVGTEIWDCGDFTILDDWSMHAQLTVFLDLDGTDVRWHLHGSASDRFYNSEDPSKELFASTRGINAFRDPWDIQGLWTTAGLMYHVNVRGVGVVLIDAGRLVRDADDNLIWFAGKHQLVVDQDFEALCSALR